MYHVTYRGTHREAGLRWGRRLASHGNLILQNVPFPITQARLQFAQQCVPIYRQFFPAVLQEIDGLAEGQGCAPQALQAVLFSMYAMPPACRCFCFAVSNGAQAFLARNSDFLLALRHLNMNVIYRLDGGGFHFTGNTTAFIEIEDGVNEHGFAAGLTAVAPSHIRPGLNAGMLLRLMLETCRTVDEALTLLHSVPVASAQTLTLADAGGAIALVECSCRRVEVLRPAPHQPFVCAANAFHTPAMRAERLEGVDDWAAAPRYRTMLRALGAKAAGMDISGAMALLAGKEGFLCQYDRHSGHGTVWAVLYDLKRRAVWRAEGSPAQRRFVQDARHIF